ncbi:hypothetical protein B0O80DRAFT_456860 [Mortierella sp. GBAus27b]|nr:hypothetical protein B0O80DRAFT_456860 [Mortierella sp. GBAus27b]
MHPHIVVLANPNAFVLFSLLLTRQCILVLRLAPSLYPGAFGLLSLAAFSER